MRQRPRGPARPCSGLLTIVAAGLTANGNVADFQVRKRVLGLPERQQLHHFGFKIGFAVSAVGFQSTTATTH